MAIGRCLGQVVSVSTTEKVLYQVPYKTQSRIEAIFVCNRGAGASTFRISVNINKNATATLDYIYYDVSISGNNTMLLEIDSNGGLPIITSNEVRVYASSNDLTFSIYGKEDVA
jgi:hypothetical protein